nr:hypothetical protein [Persicimonas caeni]
MLIVLGGVEVAAQPLEAVAIVQLAGLRVAQDAVGGEDLLEALFGAVVAGVDVGVVFAREPTVSRLERLLVGVARDIEQFVEVSLQRGPLACRTSAVRMSGINRTSV